MGSIWTGGTIRVLRLRLGISQSELARKLGCRQQTVSEWETNVYQPQNAYSRLLDMMLSAADQYAAQINQAPQSEVEMRSLDVSQISGVHLRTGSSDPDANLD